MEKEEIVSRLKTLSKTEATVLFLKCGGMDYEDIGLQIHYEVPTVQLYASTMYQKLGFDKKMHSSKRKKLLNEEICPVITRLYDMETGWLPDDPNPIPSPVTYAIVKWEYKQEQDRRLAKRQTDKIIIIDPRKPSPPPPPPPPPPTHRPYVLYAIIAILLIAVGFLLKDRFFPSIPAPIPSLNPSLNATSAPIVPIPSTETPTITPTLTITPSLTPSITPTPTWTSLPTQEVLVDTTFANGVEPWDISGPYVIQDGSITWDGSHPVIMSVGDMSWKNYRMTISFTSIDTGMCDIFMGVRVNDENKGMWLGIAGTGSLGWFNGARGYSSWISGNSSPVEGNTPIVEIKVTGNTFNWIGGTSVTVEGHPTGGVQIYFKCNRIDHIKIVKLP